MAIYYYNKDAKTGTHSKCCPNGMDCSIGSVECVNCKYFKSEKRVKDNEFSVECNYLKPIITLEDIDKAFLSIFKSGKLNSYFKSINFYTMLHKNKAIPNVHFVIDKLGMSLFLEDKKVYTMIRLKKVDSTDCCLYVPIEVDLCYFGYEIVGDLND